MVLFLISALGLWLFISEARFLYFSLVVFSLISTPFGGLSVQSGIDSMLSYISSLLDGIILYMAFFSPVSHQFKSVKSLKWKYNVSSTDLPAIDEHSLIYQLLAVIKTYKIASWCFALFVGFLFRYSYGFAKDAIWSKRNLSFMSWPIDPFSESQLLFFTVVLNFIVDLTSSLIPALICGALLVYVFQKRAIIFSLWSAGMFLVLSYRFWLFWKAPNLGLQISTLMGPILSVLVLLSATWLLSKIRNRISITSRGTRE
jgi:hypothetical protein